MVDLGMCEAGTSMAKWAVSFKAEEEGSSEFTLRDLQVGYITYCSSLQVIAAVRDKTQTMSIGSGV